MSDPAIEKAKAARPRRGAPEQTRERLVAAAAAIFNRQGYHGTDSNRIAHEAGYATGTFYKHFKDKREAFLAAYEFWLAAQWKEIEAVLSDGGAPELLARRLVDLSIDFHTKWGGLRASLMELVLTDDEVRRFYHRQRHWQLDVMARLRKSIGARRHRTEEDAIHLFTTERVYDALAHGEIEALGLSRKVVVAAMVERVREMLE
ncbi:MAG TPA: TetR/AcrR family transcriptional regulator [Bryobacteraceae bacterium]|nr:TetR/AcrR family transcriptional regulator [Bryobacteraceae bacterium]